ncbi:MAG TPA: metal-sensitive transcriptional regulator [Actinomycetota bacterium]|nr:metal-sensitive transcriptional regulator [Actinomycetota bacterium]
MDEAGPRPQIVDRLRRIQGQVAGVARMYKDGRHCIEVLDQLAAARAGLESAALLTLEDHVHGCVQGAMEGDAGAARAQELVSAVRRFVRNV